MSRTGNIRDRAIGMPLVREAMARSLMQSFHSTLKTECTGPKGYRIRDNARAEIVG